MPVERMFDGHFSLGGLSRCRLANVSAVMEALQELLDGTLVSGAYAALYKGRMESLLGSAVRSSGA